MKKLILSLCCLLCFLSHAGVNWPSDGYHSYESMLRLLKQWEKSYPQLIELQSIGRTLENRHIWLIRISNEKIGDPDEKSALFSAGNIEADHLIGGETILGTIRYILENYGKEEGITDLVDHHTCYFIPRTNPDGAEGFFAKIKSGGKINRMPVDDDHDGITDEDPPEDLNGDGLITRMRVRDPEGTFLPDSADGRLMKEADPTKGEEGLYKVYPEGIDSDNDGKFNEDPVGGVNIDHNFPHNYPFFDKDAGPYMTSESETRALIDFLIAHRNVSMILSFTSFDNLIRPPKPERPKPEAPQAPDEDMTRRFRMARKPEKSVNKKDIPYFEKVSETYRKIMAIKSPKGDAIPDKPRGTFHEWGYFQYGVLSLTTPIWRVPDLKSEQDTTKERKTMKRMPEKKEKESTDLEWLKWIDKTQGGTGFIDWQIFQHPTLGEVEIGGFDPFVRVNPPVDLLPELVEKHARFFVSLGELFPKLELSQVNVDKKADSIYRIEATLKNIGFLPTALAHGAKARAVKPTLAKLEGEGFELLAGQRIEFLEQLEGSGSAKKITWMVKAKSGSSLQIRITSEKAGNITKKIVLK